MDDDEVKDVASSGMFTADTIAYWATRCGLTNSSAVGETVTGLMYNSEAQIRYILSTINQQAFEATEAMVRSFRRALEEADTRTLDIARWSKRIYERAFSLIRSEAKKVYDLIREYRAAKVEFEEIKDDPEIPESEKNTLANMLARLMDTIPRRFLELINFANRVLSVAERDAKQISEKMNRIREYRNQIAYYYISEIVKRIQKCVTAVRNEYDNLLHDTETVINTVYELRKQQQHKQRWTTETTER